MGPTPCRCAKTACLRSIFSAPPPVFEGAAKSDDWLCSMSDFENVSSVRGNAAALARIFKSSVKFYSEPSSNFKNGR